MCDHLDLHGSDSAARPRSYGARFRAGEARRRGVGSSARSELVHAGTICLPRARERGDRLRGVVDAQIDQRQRLVAGDQQRRRAHRRAFAAGARPSFERATRAARRAARRERPRTPPPWPCPRPSETSTLPSAMHSRPCSSANGVVTRAPEKAAVRPAASIAASCRQRPRRRARRAPPPSRRVAAGGRAARARGAESRIGAVLGRAPHRRLPPA